MKTKLFISFFFLIACWSFQHAISQQSNSDAVYQSITREYTLNHDGSMKYRFIKEQKLLTYRAFHNLYGETFVIYDPAYQKLRINEAFTIMGDGKKVTSPQNAFNEVLPSFAANAPAYNNLREMVITHTGLERNAVIHLDYEVITDKGVLPALMGNERLAEPEPVNSLTFIVKIPTSANLYFQLFNSDVRFERSIDGEFQVFTWKFRDLPAISAEDFQPGAGGSYPRIQFSTLKTRGEALSFLTGQPAFSVNANSEMRSAVNNLATSIRDKFELALKIQEMVVDQMKLFPVPFKTALYKCRTPEQTWKSNGGTAVEKAALLALLFREAGIDAQINAVVRTVNKANDNGSLADIEDFTVLANFKEEGRWVFSVTSMNSVNLLHVLPGRSFIGFPVDNKKPLITAAENPRQKIHVEGTFIVSSDPKMTGEISFYFEGSVYPYAGLKSDKQKLKSGLSGCLTGRDLKEEKKSVVNVTNGFQSFIAQSDKPFRKDSNYYTMIIPYMNQGIDSWGIKTLSGKRATAFELSATAEEKYAYSFTLPEGLKLFSTPRKVTMSNKAGTFTWELKTEQGKMSLTREISLGERILSPEQYQDFKVLMDLWNNPRLREVVFVR